MALFGSHSTVHYRHYLHSALDGTTCRFDASHGTHTVQWALHWGRHTETHVHSSICSSHTHMLCRQPQPHALWGSSHCHSVYWYGNNFPCTLSFFFLLVWLPLGARKLIHAPLLKACCPVQWICHLHIANWSFLVVLLSKLECSHRIWSKNGREGYSDMTSNIVGQLVTNITGFKVHTVIAEIFVRVKISYSSMHGLSYPRHFRTARAECAYTGIRASLSYATKFRTLTSKSTQNTKLNRVRKFLRLQ